MFSEGNYGRKFNASLFNISVPFGSLVEKTAREKILNLQKNYPDAQFYMFRYTQFSVQPPLLKIQVPRALEVNFFSNVGRFWNQAHGPSIYLRRNILRTQQKKTKNFFGNNRKKSKQDRKNKNQIRSSEHLLVKW